MINLINIIDRKFYLQFNNYIIYIIHLVDSYFNTLGC